MPMLRFLRPGVFAGPLRRRGRGVTLIELLLYVTLAIVITAAVAQSLISMIRSDRNIEVQQRAIDLWGRISFLIESEVAEGSRVLYGESVPAACGGGSSLFTVQVPVVVAGGTSQRTVPIHYLSRTAAGGDAAVVDLLRCGPAYRANGSLDVATEAGAGDNLLAPVGRRLRFELLPNADAARSVHYRLNVLTPDGQLAMPRACISRARCRVAEITAPP